MRVTRGTGICLVLAWWFSCPSERLLPQATAKDEIGFDGITLGTPVAELPIACVRPVVCEDSYETVRVRVWHQYALTRRVDVIYSGRETASGVEIKRSPITLPQAIRSHSLRYGHSLPRLGFAGNDGPSRIVVDVANGIVYLADAVTENSLVTEVRYLPMTDPLVQKASASLLTKHGAWLIRASLLSRRYKNLLAEPDSSILKPSVDHLTREETARHGREAASR